MTTTIPGLWLPVDFYVSVSRTRKRTLHVPQRVVDVWAESRGIKQRSLILNMRFVLHVTLIIDLQLSRNLKLTYGHQASTKRGPTTL